ncbi:hypothetical protein SDC9_50638 [bioreactor metagenome]|uniref:Uncharacterized protein n=1 Tax=bioreactor metagenome TaxID=1076179 RepID=A0A644WLC3_9ZZZZ
MLQSLRDTGDTVEAGDNAFVHQYKKTQYFLHFQFSIFHVSWKIQFKSRCFNNIALIECPVNHVSFHFDGIT